MARSGASEHGRDRLQRMVPSLRRFARALVAGRSKTTMADDLVQSVLIGALHAHDANESSLRVSLYTSLVQLNRARHTEANDAEAARRLGRPGIVAALDRMPLDQREALLLVVLEGFSYDQTAAVLGLPRSSVVARLMRARASLSGVAVEEAGRGSHLRVVK